MHVYVGVCVFTDAHAHTQLFKGLPATSMQASWEEVFRLGVSSPRTNASFLP